MRPEGGQPVALATNGSITAPTSVTVPAGTGGIAFSVAAGSFTANGAATVTASLNGSSTSANVSLVAPSVGDRPDLHPDFSQPATDIDLHTNVERQRAGGRSERGRYDQRHGDGAVKYQRSRSDREHNLYGYGRLVYGQQFREGHGISEWGIGVSHPLACASPRRHRARLATQRPSNRSSPRTARLR